MPSDAPRPPSLPPVRGLPSRVRRSRRRIVGTALGAGILSALGLVSLVLVLAWFLAGPGGWEEGTPVPLLLVLIGLVGTATLLGGLGWAGWQRAREARLSRSMDALASLPDGTVLAHLELLRTRPEDALLARGAADVLQALDRAPAPTGGEPTDPPPRRLSSSRRLPEEGQTSRWALAAGMGLGVLLVPLAGLGIAEPQRASAAWSGLLHPIALLEPPPLPAPTLAPQGGLAPRGEPVEVRVSAPGRSSATVVHRSSGSVPLRIDAVLDEGVGQVVLPALESRARVQVETADGARSGEFEFVPADPPTVEGLELRILYPEWTRLPEEGRRGLPPRLEVPEGTELVVRGQVAPPVEQLAIVGASFGDAPGPHVATGGGDFELSWVPAASGPVRLEAEGHFELPPRMPPPLHVEVVPSPAPQVALSPMAAADADTDPAEGVEAPGTLRLALRLEAAHPWALDWIELEVETGGMERPEVVMERVSVPPGPTLVHTFELDLAPFADASGGVVLLRARAAEGSPAGQVGTSADLRVRLPGGGEQRAAAARDRQETRSAARGLAEEAAEGARELRATAARQAAEAARGARGEPAGEEELRELAREVEARRDRGPGMEALDPRDREADRTALEEMAAALGDRSPSLARLAELREELARADEALAGALEESLRALEREALAAELQEAEEAVREWGREAGADGDEEELRRLEEEISLRLDDLEEELDRREGRGSDVPGEQGPDREALQEAREALEAARERLDGAREAALAGDEARAGEERGAAAEGAERAAEALEQARMEWLEEWARRLAASFRRAAGTALVLATGQEGEQARLEVAFPRGEEVAALLEAQLSLLESARVLRRVVDPLAREAGRDGRVIRSTAAAVVERIEEVTDRLGAGQAPRGGPATEAARSRTLLNDLAEALIGASEGLADGGSPDGPDAGADPGGADDLSDQQQAVNEETAAIADDAAAGEGTSAERMENAAAGQQAVADALGGLAEESVLDEGDGDGVRFDELAQEAGSLAERLREGRLDPELLDRQAGLLERLLEAGRTLERGRTEEREGEAPGSFTRLPVTPLDPALVRGSPTRTPSPELLEGLPARERGLVLRWLDRAGRTGATPEAPR